MANKKGTPQNLKPFKKGEDPRRNLKGRPPAIPDLEPLLHKVLGEEKDNKTAMEIIIMALRSKATKGDIRAAEILMDRAYGKAKQTIDNNINVTKPIIIDWSDDDNTDKKAKRGKKDV